MKALIPIRCHCFSKHVDTRQMPVSGLPQSSLCNLTRLRQGASISLIEGCSQIMGAADKLTTYYTLVMKYGIIGGLSGGNE